MRANVYKIGENTFKISLKAGSFLFESLSDLVKFLELNYPKITEINVVFKYEKVNEL